MGWQGWRRSIYGPKLIEGRRGERGTGRRGLGKGRHLRSPKGRRLWRRGWPARHRGREVPVEHRRRRLLGWKLRRLWLLVQGDGHRGGGCRGLMWPSCTSFLMTELGLGRGPHARRLVAFTSHFIYQATSLFACMEEDNEITDGAQISA